MLYAQARVQGATPCTWKFAAKAAHGPQAFLPCRMTAYSEVDGKEVEKYQCLKKVPTEGGLGRMSPFGE